MWFVLAAWWWLLLCPAHAQRLDTEFEKLVGKQVAWGLVETSGADTDPLLLQWVRGIGAKVSAHAPRKDIPYTFHILGTDISNALAAPGGYIFVTRGLLDAVESDDELASILAHESGHVAKRHATQLVGENLLFLALVGAIKGKKYDDWKTVLGLANVLRTLGRSRGMEAQADEEGIAYAAKAGYDPQGLLRFFERIGSGRDEPKRLEQWFATHPSPTQRLQTARKNPLVRRGDPTLRQALARAYQERGLPGASKAVLRGDDPLRLPAARPLLVSPAIANERRALSAQTETIWRQLAAARKTQRLASPLQQILLVNAQPDDYRWLYLALRAYAIEANVEEVYERTARVLRTARPTHDALAAYADGPPGTSATVNASLGRGEVRRALDTVRGAPQPLGRASRAALAVLADLNNRFYHPRGNAAWVRYGTLEGLLRYAESELGRASKASGQAWRLVSLARVRRYEARLDELVPVEDVERRTQWADLLTRRLGGVRAGDPTRTTGAATVSAALAVELGKTNAEVSFGRGDAPWANWVVEKNGIPENIATVLRLLTLDLEREVAPDTG